MNVKERVAGIQNLIDELQSDISELDQSFHYYNVLIHNLCVNPMEIRVFCRYGIDEPKLIQTLFVNMLDQYTEVGNDLVKDALGAEFDYLGTISAPKQQLDELQKIKIFLGV